MILYNSYNYQKANFGQKKILKISFFMKFFLDAKCKVKFHFQGVEVEISLTENSTLKCVEIRLTEVLL